MGDQVWAADSEGGVWLRLGSLLPPPLHAAPAWIPVDGDVGAVVQVASSPSGDQVWAREAIYPELPCGAAWVEVPGLQAAWIEVSKSSVWLLDTSGLLFRRIGLSQTDWTGRSWEAVPGPRGEWFEKKDRLEAITVGQCDTLW